MQLLRGHRLRDAAFFGVQDPFVLVRAVNFRMLVKLSERTCGFGRLKMELQVLFAC